MPVQAKARLSNQEIEQRINNSPRLASLRSINAALGELVNAENSFTSQIAEIIQRDPSLTSRLLKLVNSVFFGLSRRVNNIEDAVFYLGLCQIRELALATPVIEDFESLSIHFKDTNWRDLWQHSIGTAILTREILAVANVVYEDDTDYIVGLVHNVGKLVMAYVFPEEFVQTLEMEAATTEDVCAMEQELIGWDHSRIGAHYLQRHQLSPEIVMAAQYHNAPRAASKFQKSCAAVQVADHMVRSVGICGIEPTQAVTEKDWQRLPGWQVLFSSTRHEVQLGIASLRHTLKQLPGVLKGMV